ncbi:MAG: carboxypeptidase-like regulatory domain-containing protein [Terriglobales bacterium]
MKKIFRCLSCRGVGVLPVCLIVALSPYLTAQTGATGALAGKVTDPTGTPVSNVKVTATSSDSGQTLTTVTGTDGTYKLDGLAAGSFRVRFEAPGFKLIEIPFAMVNATETAIVDTKLEIAEIGNHIAVDSPAPPSHENLPNAPSSSTTAPSLGDLGFPAEQTQGNVREQALLDKRTHMLKIHQRMGLITTGPLIATVIASLGAGGKNEGSASRDLHVALGSLTGDLYGITAYYAIRAPRVPGTETRGPIRFHKTMAWIHGPGMILTPILGAMAFDQKNKGEKVHGIASAHGPVAIVTAGAFGAALLSVSVKF